MASRPLIWLTRPEADSKTLAAELQTHGIASIIAPVMRIEPLAITPPTNKPTALLLTSRHAAHALTALPEEWRKLPIYCVGSATAAAAKKLCRPREDGGPRPATHASHGMDPRLRGDDNLSEYQMIVGDSDILTLLPSIAKDLPAGSHLLYLSGEETRADVAALLSTKSITVETSITYRALAVEALPAQFITALNEQKMTGVALFSPRSALLTSALLTQAGITGAPATMDAYCLSLNVAEAAGILRWHGLHVCHQPSYTHMVDLIVSQCAKTL